MEGQPLLSGTSATSPGLRLWEACVCGPLGDAVGACWLGSRVRALHKGPGRSHHMQEQPGGGQASLAGAMTTRRALGGLLRGAAEQRGCDHGCVGTCEPPVLGEGPPEPGGDSVLRTGWRRQCWRPGLALPALRWVLLLLLHPAALLPRWHLSVAVPLTLEGAVWSLPALSMCRLLSLSAWSPRPGLGGLPGVEATPAPLLLPRSPSAEALHEALTSHLWSANPPPPQALSIRTGDPSQPSPQIHRNRALGPSARPLPPARSSPHHPWGKATSCEEVPGALAEGPGCWHPPWGPRGA